MESEKKVSLGTLAWARNISGFTGHTGFSRVVDDLPTMGPDVHR